MLRIRRLYFYLVAYAGLSMLLAGLATVLRGLLEQVLGVESSGVLFGAFAGRGQLREQAALGIAPALPVRRLADDRAGSLLVGPRPAGAPDRPAARAGAGRRGAGRGRASAALAAGGSALLGLPLADRGARSGRRRRGGRGRHPAALVRLRSGRVRRGAADGQPGGAGAAALGQSLRPRRTGGAGALGDRLDGGAKRRDGVGRAGGLAAAPRLGRARPPG